MGLKARQELEASTGWPRPHLEAAIVRAFEPFTLSALARLFGIRGHVAPARGWLMAILAGRVPALAVNVVLWALAARWPVLLKPSTAEPRFAALLARSLPEPLQGAVRILPPDAGRDAIDQAVVEAPVVLAYGSDESVEAVRRLRIGPTLVGPHRESLILVLTSAMRTANLRQLAMRIADDVAIYDQDGCLSPTLALVEEGGEATPADLVDAIGDALVRHPLPAGRITLEHAAAVRATVETLRVRGRSALATQGRGLFPFVSLLDEPPAIAGALFRTLQVGAFRGRPDLEAWAPHLRGRVQGLAVAGDRSRARYLLQDFLAWRPGRICGVGRLQRPPAIWAENGVVVTRALARLARAEAAR